MEEVVGVAITNRDGAGKFRLSFGKFTDLLPSIFFKVMSYFIQRPSKYF